IVYRYSQGSEGSSTLFCYIWKFKAIKRQSVRQIYREEKDYEEESFKSAVGFRNGREYGGLRR
ncbi:MAG: hypothetical protein NC389_14665, partial [Acetatifactor muris]|nr:hypothetical protein [Acetatifactor muris]